MKNKLKNLTDKTLRIVFPATERLLEAVYRGRVAHTAIRKPVIVLGPDRSGTTLVYSLLANHPDCFALSTAADRFPDHPHSASMVRRIFSLGVDADYCALPDTTGGIKGGRFSVTEGIHYWTRHLGGRRGRWPQAPDDFFTEADLEETTRQTLPLDLKRRMTVLKKQRLALKQPGFSLKIRYLNAIFPDAVFVHCLRHPVDNFHSLLVQKRQSNNPDWGIRIPGWQQYADRSVEEQTARQLAGTYDLIQQSVAHLRLPASRYLPVSYEALTTNFIPEIKSLFAGCDLEVPAHILAHPENYVRAGRSRQPDRPPPADPAAREILEKLAADMGYPTQPLTLAN